MTKVQLSLTNEEAAILSGYGEQFGYNLPKMIRFIISKATERALQEKTIPFYHMSEETEDQIARNVLKFSILRSIQS